MQQTDLIISGAYLLPLPQQASVLRDQAVAIGGDTITAIGPAGELHKKYPTARQLHTPHGLIMPGLINSHTHAAMAILRGIADDLPLMTWLSEHIFPVEARLTPEMVYKGTLLSIAEMIKSGTTSFCDMYLFSREVAKATAEAGMRAWIGEVLYDFPSPCYGELENGFAYIREMYEEYRNHPLISITADPHAVYTCSPELLTRLADIARQEQSLLHIHLAENRTEVETCMERYGRTPVRHLAELGILSPQVIAAHCVVLDDEEIALLAENGCGVSHCLESNMKLASGLACTKEMIGAGIALGLGTDGSASNNDVDMFGEMSSVAKVHKGMCFDPTVMDAESTLHAATLGSATALKAEQTIGSIAVGKKADLIVLDMDQPHLTPCYNIPSHLVYAARGADVIHSVIGGRVVMQDRALQTIDETALLAQMRELARAIRHRS